MSFLNLSELKEELVVFLRNQDVLTIAARGVTTVASETFSGDASTTDFLINRTNVRNIRSITVGGNPQTFGTDYTVNYSYDDAGTIKCLIEFTSAPASGTDNIDVSYDYGSDKIFSDYPRNDLSISSYPRIAVDVIAADSEEVAVGGGTIRTNVTISVSIYDDNQNDVERILANVRNAFLNNKKNLYNITFITPIGLGPLVLSPERGDKIVSRTLDLLAPLNYEE